MPKIPTLNPAVNQRVAKAIVKQAKKEVKELKADIKEAKETVKGWAAKYKATEASVKERINNKILDAACETWTSSSSKC